jgi:hypothetical protein
MECIRHSERAGAAKFINILMFSGIGSTEWKKLTTDKSGRTITGFEIQGVPLKTGPLTRRNQASGPVLSGTFCIVTVYKHFDCALYK